MSKRGENIYRRKDGRWEARYKKGTAAGWNDLLWLLLRENISGSEGKKYSGIDRGRKWSKTAQKLWFGG